MSPEKRRARHTPARSGKKQGSFDIPLPIRLGIASVLVMISALFSLPALVRIILLILSAALAGYDIFLTAVDRVAEKDYLSTPLVMVFTVVLSFVIGYTVESAVMIILYQLSGILIDYTRNRSIQSAKKMLDYQDDDVKGRMEEIISADKAGRMGFEGDIEKSASFVLRFVMLFAALYAILMPFISDIGFRISFHRALMILLISSPMSVAVSFPIVGITGLCASGKLGILYNSAATMEQTTSLNVAIFDKAGVFSAETPHLIGLQSDVLDKKTFLNFLAHAVYYSDQPFAKAISDYYDQEYRLDLINNFSELPGNGVVLEIGNAPVTLASRSYFDSQGINIPDRGSPDGTPFYMTIANRYVGRVVISSEINQEAVGLTEEMAEAGVLRNILLTEDSNEESQATAEALHFSEVIGECDMDRKLRLISDISQDNQNNTAFIYANGIEGHSAADLDIRISRKGKYADIIALPDYYLNIPASIQICRRTKEIVSENAIFVFVVKAILIFLSFIGYSNLWFVVFIDTVAALATLLNASRVTMPAILKRKRSDREGR